VRDDGAGGGDTAQLLIRDAEGQRRGARRLVRAVVSPDGHRPHNLEIDTSHFFTDLTSKADTEISKLYEEAEGALFGAAGPLPQPTTDSSSNTDSLSLRTQAPSTSSCSTPRAPGCSTRSSRTCQT